MSEHVPYRNARFNQALMFAVVAHGNQVRKGNLYVPYVVHCVDVAKTVIYHGGLNEEEQELAAIAALLHDTVEDTSVTLDDVRAQFGEEVAMAVQALTKSEELHDDASVSKAEELEENLERLSNAPRWVQCVKLADRLSNLEVFPAFWPRNKVAEYLEQSVRIAERLGSASRDLHAMLLARISDRRVILSIVSSHREA